MLDPVPLRGSCLFIKISRHFSSKDPQLYPAEISAAKHNFATATDIFCLRPNFSLNLAKNIGLELATLIDVNNIKYSPVLRQI
jgi:hypothetical protein